MVFLKIKAGAKVIYFLTIALFTLNIETRFSKIHDLTKLDPVYILPKSVSI